MEILSCSPDFVLGTGVLWQVAARPRLALLNLPIIDEAKRVTRTVPTPVKCRCRSGVKARAARSLSGAIGIEVVDGVGYAACSLMVTAKPSASILRWSRFASTAGS